MVRAFRLLFLMLWKKNSTSIVRALKTKAE